MTDLNIINITKQFAIIATLWRHL